MRYLLAVVIWAATSIAPASIAPAAAQAVDLQLILAVDVSGSVSAERFELQRQGYAAAFRHPRVLEVIQSGQALAIAVTMVQWTGPALQIQVIPWTRLSDQDSVHAFAAAVEAAPRRLFGGGTSLSGIIDYAVPLFGQGPFQAARKVIDISGDGANNRGRSVLAARDEAVAAGVVINGLPILAIEPSLDRYFENNVIGGPGAFVVAATNYETFAQAILQKLVVEIAGAPAGPPGLRHAGAVPERP